MSALSSDLLAILDSNSSISGLAARDSDLWQAITGNADALNAIGNEVESASKTARARLACKAGQLIFGARAVTPKGTAYQEEEKENWSMACWLPAACFLKVTNSLEVAIALKLVTFTKATFAVRSGGHNPNPGFGSIDQAGVLIDLRAINSIALSSDKSIASIGPGATWDKVYDYLEQHELTVVGGRVAGVGVGGLILGGNIVPVAVCIRELMAGQIVLADSTIVQVNANSNPDLFKALKGGGPNFGIVTRYDLYTNPDYRLWYTFKVYNASEVDRVMQAAVEVEKAMDTDDKIGFFLTQGVGTLTAGMLYRGWTDFPSVFHAFDGIPVMMDAVPNTNGTQASGARATAIDALAKYGGGAATVKPNVQLYKDLQGVLQSIAGDSNFTLAFTYQPLGAPAAQKGQAKGGNVVNIRPEMQSWLAILAQWTEAADDDTARSKTHQLISSIESTAKSRGLLIDFCYQNDASYAQSPLSSYGEESLAYLKTVAEKYDPGQVFQTLQNSGFLLSRV